jgi:hypothetical protein
MQPITIPYNFTPRPYQQEIFKQLDSGKLRLLLRWSRRAGKDLTCFNLMVKKAFERVGSYYYFFPEYSQGKKALWEGMDMDGVRFIDRIPKEWVIKKNNNEMKLELGNGSIIRVIGTENFDSIMGTNPIGCVFSEFSLQNPAAWDFIRPILAQNGGWAIFNGTPRGKNHMYQLEVDNTANPDWFISELQSLWPDLPNYFPVVTQEQIDKERASGMTEEVIEQEFGVSYIAGQKGAYYMDCITKARAEGRIGAFSPNFNKPVDILLDLGITDDTAIWFRQIDGNRLIWIDYYENNTKDLAFYAKILKEKGYPYRAGILPHDGRSHTIQTMYSNKELFQRLCQELGINIDFYVADRPSSKQIPIILTRERFPRYHFNEPLVAEGIKKLSLYHRQWDRGSQSFRDIPAHDWTSHCADSIALDGLTQHIFDGYSTTGQNIDIKTDFDPFTYDE